MSIYDDEHLNNNFLVFIYFLGTNYSRKPITTYILNTIYCGSTEHNM